MQGERSTAAGPQEGGKSAVPPMLQPQLHKNCRVRLCRPQRSQGCAAHGAPSIDTPVTSCKPSAQRGHLQPPGPACKVTKREACWAGETSPQKAPLEAPLQAPLEAPLKAPLKAPLACSVACMSPSLIPAR